MTTQIFVDRLRTLGVIEPTLFGGFLEHMGRAIYQGIYEPGSPFADERGFRRDVLQALRELAPTIIRYPGGNFLSGYHWMDGIGPKEQRPRRRELAWKSIETNQFGVDEFIEYCRELDTQPMLGVNLGTGTLDEAGALVEYCNAPQGTYYADLRARYGHPEPFGVKVWCLGNEMDGPWQIGHLEAHEYARKALETAKIMKWQDSSIRLVLCGSSSAHMPTFPEWDRVALEECWEQVDYLSLHQYVGNYHQDTQNYLGLTRLFEYHLQTLEGTLRYVKAKRRSKHDVFLSWDEWNVWYKAQEMDGRWTEAPHLIEEVYNLEDALVVALWMNVFLRFSHVLKIACMAQLVNIIAPILTRTDGLVRQTIYYPFQLFRRYASGKALDVLVHSPQVETREYGEVPLVDVSGSYDEESGRTALFLVNRSLNEAETVTLNFTGWTPGASARVISLAGSDPKLANTFENPYVVAPQDAGTLSVQDGTATLRLPPLSFTVIAFGG